MNALVVSFDGLAICLRLALQCRYEGRILALKLLDRTAAPALCQGRRHGVGKDFFLPLLHSVEESSCDGFWRGLRYVQGSGHLGIYRSGQDGMSADAPSSQQSAE